MRRKHGDSTLHHHCAGQRVADLKEYEAVRRWPNHFFVKPGHIFPEVERIVDYAGKDGTRYEVVEKFGEGGKVAVELDQRRASSG
jgi:hypothetical protein